jgi:Tfp pilus assembly protein PilO
MVNKTRTTTKIYISFALGILLLGATGFLIKQIYDKSGEIKIKKTQLIGLANDMAALDKILRDKQEHEEVIETVLKSIPRSYREVAFYQSQIEHLSRARSQILDTAIDKNAEVEGQLHTLRFTTKTIGSFPPYTYLLSDLATLPYHIKIDSLKIEKDGSNVVASTNFKLYITEE